MRIIPCIARACLLAMMAAGSIATAAPPTEGDLRTLWRQGDLRRMEQLAEQGDVRAQRWMGLMLRNRGRYEGAIHWYSRAVDQGDGRAANEIASFYEHGVGRPRDAKAAMDWHRKGASLGDFDSQVRYASALRSGSVVARNEREAFVWYSRAARQRDVPAQLGYAYLPLAEMHVEGHGTPRDLRRAYAFAKAAELTVDDSDTRSQSRARSLQEDIVSRLSSTDLKIAERLFRTLRPDLAERADRQRSAARAAIGLLVLLVAAGLVIRRIGGRATRQLSARARPMP